MEIFLSSWTIGTCEGGLELAHCPGYVVPENAGSLVAELLLPQGFAVTARKESLSLKERHAVREFEVTS